MTDKSFHIVIADDHPVLLEGIVSVIQKEFINAIIHKAANGAIALQQIIEMQPEIVVLDIEMPFLDGIEVARKIRAAGMQTKLVFLTLHKERTFFNEVRALDIQGYVLKEFSINEICLCIYRVLEGKTYFSSSIEKLLNDTSNTFPDFTKTELNIVKLIATGKTTKEIAEMLFVSTKTIESHRYNITKKLNLPSEKNSLLKWAMKHIR